MTIKIVLPERFPAQLRELPSPPEKLWLRGSLPSPDHKILTVVGSRALTHYGRECCEMLIKGLRGYPISIVSGLALGADACAHRAALDVGLHTLAVPGSGLHDSVIGPKTNFGLAQQILASGGGLLSEHEPDYTAHSYDFPSRNRIMVGLADAVLVIEAGQQSGTLITARLTTEYNRDLLCIPHRIGDPHGYGNHFFLRMGAALVTESAHILEALHLDQLEEHKKPPPILSPDEQKVYDSLEIPQSRDELIRETKLSTSTLLTTLLSLELKSLVIEAFGAWRRK